MDSENYLKIATREMRAKKLAETQDDTKVFQMVRKRLKRYEAQLKELEGKS